MAEEVLTQAERLHRLETVVSKLINVEDVEIVDGSVWRRLLKKRAANDVPAPELTAEDIQFIKTMRELSKPMPVTPATIERIKALRSQDPQFGSAWQALMASELAMHERLDPLQGEAFNEHDPERALLADLDQAMHG